MLAQSAAENAMVMMYWTTDLLVSKTYLLEMGGSWPLDHDFDETACRGFLSGVLSLSRSDILTGQYI
jgi:hypothetical protein